jgi:putative ATP-binding cassette transporter
MDLPKPTWRESLSAWRLLLQTAGSVRMAMAALFMVSTSALRAWCQVFQLGALTALYNSLASGAGAALDALQLYLMGSGLVLALYLVQQGGSIRLELWLRQHLTAGALQRYLADRSYCRLRRQLAIDHPDQRITEDAAEMASYGAQLGMSLISECLSLVSFLVVLSGAGLCLVQGWPAIAWGPGLVLPALALITAGFGTAGGLWLGRHLAIWDNLKERQEAGLRRECLLVREQAEQIAALREEPLRAALLHHRLSDTIRSQGRWLFGRMRLEAFRLTERDLTKLLPLAVAAWAMVPDLSMGQIIQMVGAFISVVESGQWLVRNLSSVRVLKAASWRLGTFLDSLGRKQQAEADSQSAGSLIQGWSQQIQSLPLQPKDRLIVQGASGSGKTQLLQQLLESVEGATLVPFHVAIPPGILKDWLDPHHQQTLPTLAKHLTELGLAGLLPLLERQLPWHQLLSTSQQKRLALLRCVLQGHSLLLLDEPFCALDHQTAAQVVQWLTRVQQAPIIVASHQPDALQNGTRWATIEDGQLLLEQTAAFSAAHPE